MTYALQVEEEISRLFDFMEFTYGLFGFEFSLELSTRPENYLGQVETWNEAEAVSLFSIPAPQTLVFLGSQFSAEFSHPTDRSLTTAIDP